MDKEVEKTNKGTTSEQVNKFPNINPTGKGGFGDNPQNRNNGGRIPNPLKSFQRKEFNDMTDEQKRDFLNDIDKYKKWTMAEGNPESQTDITTNGESLTAVLVKFIDKEEQR